MNLNYRPNAMWKFASRAGKRNRQKLQIEFYDYTEYTTDLSNNLHWPFYALIAIPSTAP